MRRIRWLPFSVAALLLATGCNAMGPTAVRGAGSTYTQALAETQEEQMLLNVVRLRYLDTPMFLEVTSLNTQYELRTDGHASIGGSFGDSLSEYSGSAGVGAAYTEKPTVSYVPLRGNDFVQRLLSPISLDTVSLLGRSGWNPIHVWRVCLSSLGHVQNAPLASGPTPSESQDVKPFLEALRLMKAVVDVRGARLDSNATDGYFLLFDPSKPEVADFLTYLHLPVQSKIPMRDRLDLEGPTLNYKTRSILGIMFVLSLGIEIPPEHVADGTIPIPRRAALADLTEGLMKIGTSTSRPDYAHVSVHYRDRWFYIDDRDFTSKATFAMLQILFSLQSGDRTAAQPVLTIPL